MRVATVNLDKLEALLVDQRKKLQNINRFQTGNLWLLTDGRMSGMLLGKSLLTEATLSIEEV
jgi:hypothetical protein